MALAVLFNEERIAALYEKHHGASYEGLITLHTLVELMYSAVIEHKPVGSAVFEGARKAGKLSVSDEAAYGNIRLVEQSLSNALVGSSMEPLMEMFPEVVETRVPAQRRRLFRDATPLRSLPPQGDDQHSIPLSPRHCG